MEIVLGLVFVFERQAMSMVFLISRASKFAVHWWDRTQGEWDEIPMIYFDLILPFSKA